MDDGELERRLFTPPKFDEKRARFAALLVPAAIVFASSTDGAKPRPNVVEV
jgi:hypothetical protein